MSAGRDIAAEFIRLISPDLDRNSTRVLDVGCGEGVMGLELCAKVGHITLLDPSAAAIASIGTRIRELHIENTSTVHGDIFAVDPELRFDLITFFLSLHHIADIDSVLRRCRDLSHSGTLVALAEMAPGAIPFHRHDPVPHDTLDPDFVIGKLQEHGFRVLRKVFLPDMYRLDKEGVSHSFAVYMIASIRV